MRKLLLIIAALLPLVATSGCYTLADARTAKGSGSFRIYDKPYDLVWATAMDIIKASDLEIVSADKDQGQILAQQGVSFLSYGENVAVFLEEVGGKTKTRVEVVSKLTMSTNIFAPRWESRILSKLDKRLGAHEA